MGLASLGLANVVLAGKPGAISNPDTCLDDFESVAGWETQNGVRVEAAESAAVGQAAIKFSFPDKSPGWGFRSATHKVNGIKSKALDQLNDGYEGISFWAKGDGSDLYGTIVLCGGHPLYYPYRYAYAFPLKDTGWKKYTVAWEEFVPEDACYPVGTPGGLPPSGIASIRVGNVWTTYHNDKPIPKHSYYIDQIQVEEKVPFARNTPTPRQFADIQRLLREKKPVRIFCLGDSITTGVGVNNRDTARYAQVLERLLKKQFGYEDIHVESRAVGGAGLNDLRRWVDRDFADAAPDLVTIMVGYNDKSWAMPKEYYAYSMNDLVDRIVRKTKGASALLLMPLIPGLDARFLMMDDYADCTRTIAKDRGLSICDLNQKFKSLGRENLNAYMSDQAHPNAKGHEVIAAALAEALAGEKPGAGDR